MIDTITPKIYISLWTEYCQ